MEAARVIRLRRWVARRERRPALRDRCRRAADRLARAGADTSGGVLALVAVAAVALIGFAGIGIDAGRGYMVKSRLSSALDAASLAGGTSFFLPTRDQDVHTFFRANFPDGYMDAAVDGPVIVVDEANEKLQVSATATVPTTFMALFGFPDLAIAASAEVTRSMKALDVVLSIDISGSMLSSVPGTSTKRIDAAKQAAKDLVDILFGADSEKALLNIGLVPWSSKVKVWVTGKTFNSVMTTAQTVPVYTNADSKTTPKQTLTQIHVTNASPVPLLVKPPATWKGCVFSRYVNNTSDADDGDIRDGPFTGGGASWPGWAPVLPGDDPNYPIWAGEPVSGKYADGKPKNCALGQGNECEPCPSVGITPLQNKKATILSSITALTANSDNNTNIPEGLGWAWRVLTPEPPFTEAVPDPDYARDQAIVLLTDGENCADWGDAYKRVFGSCDGGRAKMNDRLLKLASNIKSTGVIIYVVQFAHAGSDLQTLLKKVASGSDAPYYYFAPNSADLRKAFREIANHLSELRLSK